MEQCFHTFQILSLFAAERIKLLLLTLRLSDEKLSVLVQAEQIWSYLGFSHAYAPIPLQQMKGCSRRERFPHFYKEYFVFFPNRCGISQSTLFRAQRPRWHSFPSPIDVETPNPTPSGLSLLTGTSPGVWL